MGFRRIMASLPAALTYPLDPRDFVQLVRPVVSARQLRAVVTSVSHPAPGTATIAFRPGSGWQQHQAGQWARIGVEIDGVRHWRSYSLSSAEGSDPEITVSAQGLVSRALVEDTAPGAVLFLAAPEGQFVLPAAPRPLLMLTAGSGITPVMSMIRTLIPRQPAADVVLIHSAPDASRSLFLEELLELSDQFPGLRVEPWFTSERGRLPLDNSAVLRGICPDLDERTVFTCGPEAFMNAVETLGERESLAVESERFAPPPRPDSAAGSGGTVRFEGSDRKVDVAPGQTLLDAGEKAGVLLPSGCRMGICHACLVPLRSGWVRDQRTGADCGDADTLIQTCVNTAVGDVLVDA